VGVGAWHAVACGHRQLAADPMVGGRVSRPSRAGACRGCVPPRCG
jgi:hypothetical protein